MTYTFKVYDVDDTLVGEETVVPTDYMSVFGTENPTENDLTEAGAQLLRYYKGTRLKILKT